MNNEQHCVASEPEPDAPKPEEHGVEHADPDVPIEALREPRLVRPGRPAKELQAGTAGVIGRDYLKAAIAGLEISPPSAEPAEWDLEAGE